MPSQNDTDTPSLSDFYSLASCSKEEFIEKYKKYDKMNAVKLHSQIATEMANTIIKADDINNFKRYFKLLHPIKDFEDKETLQDFNESIDKSLKNYNFIILACKYNRYQILKYIVENSATDIDKCLIDLENKDEENHNAFYYAIRIGNCKLIETLLDLWPSQYLINLDKVYELLAQAYEELKLKNVVLSNEVITFVEKRLINYRFYSDSSEKIKNIKISHCDIVERIELVVDNINLLNAEFLNINKLDEKFFLRARFIVQNINILKRQMKFTYCKLPWEEIEFCLIAYINSEQKTKLPIFNFFLRKSKLLSHLYIFSRKLNDEKITINEISINRLLTLPKCTREKGIDDIVKVSPEFKELYDDYRQLRDTYSLEIINQYLDLSLSADASEKEGQLVITRTLQVIGEYVKNTWESPKMSEFTSKLLLSSLPSNTRQIIIDLRNSLSHNNSQSQRLNIENDYSTSNFFSSIQNDTKIISSVIKNILCKTQTHHIATLLKTIASSQTRNDIKSALETFNFEINSTWFKDKFKFYENDSLQKLIDKLNAIITNKTSYETLLFDKLKQMSKYLYSSENDLDYASKLLLLKEMRKRINDDNINDNSINEIKYFANRALLNMSPDVDLKNCQKIIFDTLFNIVGCSGSRISSEQYDYLMQVINTIFTRIGLGMHNMKWLEELRDKLYKSNYSWDSKKINNVDNLKESKNSSERSKQEYILKLSTLKNIIESNNLNKDLTIYQNNKKLQAVIEMLVLDVMSILDGSKNILVDNHLLLDKSAPLLIGKNLRNHLAHGNALIDILLFDSSIAIFLNATKLTTENIIECNKKLGKVIQNNLTELKSKYQQDLMTVSNQEAMFESLEQGDFDTFKNTLARGADIHARSYRLWTALHFAAKGSNCEIIKFILDQKVEVNVKDINGQSPLHVAAEYGRTDIVRFFLSKKISSIDVVDNYGETPLHIAAQQGHRELVEILLKNNCKIKIFNHSGYMPLHCAALNGHENVLRVLLKKEKNVDHRKSFDGKSILHLATEHGHTNLVKYLVNLKADVNTKTGRNQTPLHEAALNGHVEIVEILIYNKADINIASVDGLTPLHNAVETGREKIVEILLQHGAQLNNIYNPDNYAAINHAAKYGHLNVLKLLLKYEAKVNIETKRRMTPLHFAALYQHSELVDILIKNEALLDVKDIEGFTPLHFACIKGNEQIAKLLLDNGASINIKDNNNQTPLHVAASHGQIEAVKVLIAKGAHCNSKDIKGMTALSLSSHNGYTDIVKFLIEQGVDIDSKNLNGATSLYEAARTGHEEIVKMLKEAGADVNVTDFKGASALYISAFEGHVKVVKYLLHVNTKTDIKDGSGLIPLHAAVEGNHQEIVKILLKKCSVDIADKQSRTPLMIAAKLNHVEIVKLLIKHGANVKAGAMQPLVIATISGHKSIVDIFLKHRDINVNDLIQGTKMNLLHLAVSSNHNHIVETLIANKADVNAKCLHGTPLFEAADKGYTDIVDTLLKNNADPDIQDDDKRTALEFAVSKGHLEIVKLLFQHTKMKINNKGVNNFTMLHIAAQEGCLDVVKYLVEKGADVNAANAFGSKPIHIAAREGHKSIVEYFLSIGMNINSLGDRHRTPLHFAAGSNKKEVVEYLISQQVDVNIRDIDGISPLHIAAHYGSKETVEILLNNGAAYNIFDNITRTPREMTGYHSVIKILTIIDDLFEAVNKNNLDNCKSLINQGVIINVVNKDLFSPLHYASWQGFTEIVNILLINHANPNIATKNGSTPLHYAAKFGHLEIVKLLLSHGAIYDVKTNKNNKPVDLSDKSDIIKIIKLIDKLFLQVEARDTTVITELRKIEASDIKMITNARNSKNETLMVAAANNNFPNVENLKFGFLDISLEINKAKKLSAQEKYSEALIVVKSTYEKQKKILGPDDLGSLDIKLEIAQLNCSLHNYEEALKIYQEIYSKQSKLLGVDSKDTLRTRSMMGLVFYKLGRNEEAIDIYRDTFEKQKVLLDPNDENLLYTQTHMALVLMVLNKFDEALKINYDIFKKYKIKFGANDPRVLIVQNNIAKVLAHQGKHDEALKTYEDVYQIRKKVLGQNNSNTLRTLYNKVEVYVLQKNYDQAVSSCQQVLDIQKKILGSNHVDTLNTQVQLGNIFFKRNDVFKALKVFKEAFERMKIAIGSNHPDVLNLSKIITSITQALESTGDFNQLKNIENKIISESANDKNLIKHLIENGIDINTKDGSGFTFLHYAVNNGDIDIVKFLIKNGANCILSSNKGNTPLHCAVSKNNEIIVDILLKHVKEINNTKLHSFIDYKTTAGGMTCMHVAAKNGFEGIVKLLLKYGATYDARNFIGNKTPLDICENKNIIKLLKFLNELFNDLKTNKSIMISKLKKLTGNELEIIKNARNSDNNTLTY